MDATRGGEGGVAGDSEAVDGSAAGGSPGLAGADCLACPGAESKGGGKGWALQAASTVKVPASASPRHGRLGPAPVATTARLAVDAMP